MRKADVANRDKTLFKPALFGKQKGADASGCLYTLIETAKAAGHGPYWYLRYLFVQLPQMETALTYQPCDLLGGYSFTNVVVPKSCS